MGTPMVDVRACSMTLDARVSLTLSALRSGKSAPVTVQYTVSTRLSPMSFKR